MTPDVPSRTNSAAAQESWPQPFRRPGVYVPVAMSLAACVVVYVLVGKMGWRDQTFWTGTVTLGVLTVAFVWSWWWRRCEIGALTDEQRQHVVDRGEVRRKLKLAERSHRNAVSTAQRRLNEAKNPKPRQVVGGVGLTNTSLTIGGRTIPLTPAVLATCDPGGEFAKRRATRSDSSTSSNERFAFSVRDSEGKTDAVEMSASLFDEASDFARVIGQTASASAYAADRQVEAIAAAEAALAAAKRNDGDVRLARKRVEAHGPDPRKTMRPIWRERKRQARLRATAHRGA